MSQKTTVTLPAGTVLTTTKALTVGGHEIEANAEVTLGSSVTVTVGDNPDNELPEGSPGGSRPTPTPHR